VIDITQMQTDLGQVRARLDALERTIQQRGVVARATGQFIRQTNLPPSFLDHQGFRAFVGVVAPATPIPRSGEIGTDLVRAARAQQERKAAGTPV
jgi:hypothetical protein